MPTVYQRAAARNDLVEHFVYLAENAGLNVAEVNQKPKNPKQINHLGFHLGGEGGIRTHGTLFTYA